MEITEGHEALDAALARYATLVAQSPHNLVSARAREELETRHIPECVAFAEILPSRGRFLDIGSGGGFPGMIVALHSRRRTVHLLDATRKKTAFLREAARELGVDVQVHTGRAEDLSATVELRASFDVVTARAVAPLATLVDWATPFLSPAGCLYAIKGERWAEELVTAAAALRHLGLEIRATPDDDDRCRPTLDRAQAPKVVMLGRAT